MMISVCFSFGYVFISYRIHAVRWSFVWTAYVFVFTTKNKTVYNCWRRLWNLAPAGETRPHQRRNPWTKNSFDSNADASSSRDDKRNRPPHICLHRMRITPLLAWPACIRGRYEVNWIRSRNWARHTHTPSLNSNEFIERTPGQQRDWSAFQLVPFSFLFSGPARSCGLGIVFEFTVDLAEQSEKRWPNTYTSIMSDTRSFGPFALMLP